MRIASLAIVGLTLSSSLFLPLPQARAEELPRLNQKVLTFARRNLGRKVGNGECWTLPHRALRQAGAFDGSARNRNPSILGRLILDRHNVLPGDIIWIENARWRDQSGRVYTGARRHFGIVDRAISPSVFVILHQNYGNKPTAETTVVRTDYNLDDLAGGNVRFYRPTLKQP
jgi:hypothetical protein